MGRRSINTTKSGKYMNPTDQARKEARKKELKKNKKQRQLVRAAVLKGKDPSQIIEEMEKIDQMEYNVMQPPPLNEKVLKDKRKKLKETLDRVLKMYAKDEQEKWLELKDQLLQYERRKIDLVSYFEAVRHAQQVHVDEIPLPSSTTTGGGGTTYPGSTASQIPLPDIPQQHSSHMFAPSLQPPGYYPLMTIPVPPSILKKTSSYNPTINTTTNNDLISSPTKEPPGVPPFVPPDFTNESLILLSSEKSSTGDKERSKSIRFSDDKGGEDNENSQDNENREKNIIKVKPTSVQQKMLAMAGQDIDEFMRDMESAHKKKEIERAQDLNTRLSQLEDNNKIDGDFEKQQRHSSLHLMQHHGMPSMAMPPPPPPLLFRPPPPPMHMRMPPPPPPRIGLRLPPGPPPGMPRMLRSGPPSMPRLPPPSQSTTNNPQGKTPNVLSAAPQLINRKDEKSSSSLISSNQTSSSALTTIQAKPQIRNLAADVTRFLPTSVRVKRVDDKKKLPSTLRLPERIVEVIRAPQTKTKDDAYMQFMQEMENLL